MSFSTKCAIKGGTKFRKSNGSQSDMTHRTIVYWRAMKALVRSSVLLHVGCLIAFADDATARWSWQDPQCTVVARGDLEWAPQEFKFNPGPSIHYIDFESGSDTSNGSSKQTAWKHHPWDPNATGDAKICKGAHTYVFKQGV